MQNRISYNDLKGTPKEITVYLPTQLTQKRFKRKTLTTYRLLKNKRLKRFKTR